MKGKYEFAQGMLITFLIAAVGVFIVAILINYDIIDNPFDSNKSNTNIGDENSEFVMTGYTLEELAKCVTDYYITDDMTAYEKYKTLHDFIINWAVYDHQGLYLNDPETHDPRLVFAYGRGVCDAYAKAYKALCDEVGLYCRIITGTAGGPHAWNIIQLNGISYHVDVTWDDPCYTDGTEVGLVYDYWLLSDDTLRAEGRVFENYNCTDDSYEYTEVPNKYIKN